MQTITIAPAEWITTEQTAKILGKNARTVQEMAKDGRLKWKPAGPPHPHNARLYEAKDVTRFTEQAEGLRRTPRKTAETGAVAVRQPKPTQSDRALDTVSIVGQIMVSHKTELEMLVAQSAKNLETVVSMILTSHKAEADANRERIKADREDARERWEIERKDKLERERRRVELRQLPAPPLKARRAHA